VSTQVLRGVREGGASLGICWDAADLRGLHHWPWRGDRLAVVMPPGHPLARAIAWRWPTPCPTSTSACRPKAPCR
jgi:DNA-binding transcriptional LysR family regulator